MTQNIEGTVPHLTPAVVSAATGVILAPLAQVMDVIDTLSDGRIPAADVDQYAPLIRAELVRQFPWLAEIRMPDFEADLEVDTRVSKYGWIAELVTERGGICEVQPGTLTGLPELPANARIVR